jgi:NAD(P)-dependent dehydrogenase (short-subunit alcohol dehydrogenase family)
MNQRSKLAHAARLRSTSDVDGLAFALRRREKGQDRSPREDDVDFDFAGRLIIITGGAHGMRRVARPFSQRRVIIGDRNEQAVLVTARLTGGLVATIDLAEEAPVEALIARRKAARAQRVNRSGVPQRAHRTMKDWDFVARIDLHGTYVCCRAVGSAACPRH